MPSASTKPENKAPPEAADPMKQVLLVVEKKVRNLEKRKVKLDQYRQKENEGEILNKDQKDAIGKYDAVINNLEFARELQKQFIGIGADAEKYLKKQAKREKLETRKAEVKHFQEILHLQGLLDNMGTDAVREDFKTGKNGATQLSETHLEHLDKLYKLVSPLREGETSYDKQVFTASDHLMNFLEGREKAVAGTTYKELKDLVQKIHDCRYFDENKQDQEEKTEEIDDEKKDEGNEKNDQSDNTGDEAETERTEEPITLHQPNNQLTQLTAGVGTVGTLEAESSVATQLPQSQIEPPSLVAISQQPAVADPTAATLGTNSQNLAGLASGFQEQDDSFFTTTPYSGQRAFTDIVSSVQGTFNFLQDSHIESSNSPHMDPAVVAAQPMTIPNMSQTPTGGDYSASSLLTSGNDRTSRPQSQTTAQTESTSQQQQLESTYSTGLDYGQQNQMSNLQNTHNTFGSEASSGSHQMTGLEQTVPGISNTPDVPPSIPLPNQTSMGGNANLPDSQANISQDSQEKKHYMNPNAVTFQSRSMYNQSSSGAQGNDYAQQQQQQPPPQTQQQSHTSSSGMDSNNFNNDYQGSSTFDNSNYGQSHQGSGNYGNNYNRSGRDGSRGGPRGGSGRGRGGSGSSGGMSNGYNQRGGGRSNGPFNNSRGGGYNGSNRGGSRGAFQGYPPRSDYQPEGGYQGYSNGYTSSSSNFGKRGGAGGGGGPPRGTHRGAAAGGGMRGGPRGGMRGGSGGRGGYGGQRSGSQQ